MEDLVKLIELVKEYSKDVHVDYERESVLLFIHKKYLQDFLLRIDKTDFDILFKTIVDNTLFCLVLGVSGEFFSIPLPETDDED